jgi:hypothetical protein
MGDTGGAGAFGVADILLTLRANWLNGVPKADQKMTAKSLIRLDITPENAVSLATATGIDPQDFTVTAKKIRKGETLKPEDITLLGRFDAIVSALLDEAYEQADQQYRNWSKFYATLAAILLAAIGGGIIYCGSDPNHTPWKYLGSPELLTAILIGLVSTPLAPIAKDLSSAIGSAVKAVGSLKR